MSRRYQRRPSPLDDVDPAVIRAAYEAHKDDVPKFTRRKAIHIADQFGVKPMHMVWRLERMGLLKRGSWEWFAENGGITAEHIKIVRTEAEADRRARPQTDREE